MHRKTIFRHKRTGELITLQRVHPSVAVSTPCNYVYIGEDTGEKVDRFIEKMEKTNVTN